MIQATYFFHHAEIQKWTETKLHTYVTRYAPRIVGELSFGWTTLVVFSSFPAVPTNLPYVALAMNDSMWNAFLDLARITYVLRTCYVRVTYVVKRSLRFCYFLRSFMM